MKSVSLAMISLSFAGAAMAREHAWYDIEAAAGDPLVTVNRMGLGFEYTEAAAARQKLTLSTTLVLGEKDGRNDWALGLEVPFLRNEPIGGGDDEGIGDLKLQLAHTWLENQTWVFSSYLDSEFDTAASNVQAIANQRNQLTLGSGFIRNFGDGWAVGAALQYGWSLDAGDTNGSKSEWEFRTGLRKKLVDTLSATIIYKGTILAAEAGQYLSTIEPSLNWTFDSTRHANLFFACEIPLENGREDFVSKIGLTFIF